MVPYSGSALIGAAPIATPTPPVFSNLDKAYETCKFKSRKPRNGCCIFCVIFVCNALYTERPMGLRNGRGGASRLIPGNAQTYPNNAVQGWSKSAEDVSPRLAKSTIV